MGEERKTHTLPSSVHFWKQTRRLQTQRRPSTIVAWRSGCSLRACIRQRTAERFAAQTLSRAVTSWYGAVVETGVCGWFFFFHLKLYVFFFFFCFRFFSPGCEILKPSPLCAVYTLACFRIPFPSARRSRSRLWMTGKCLRGGPRRRRCQSSTFVPTFAATAACATTRHSRVHPTRSPL